MKEIERKFLATSDAYKSESLRQFKIEQGYLNADPVRSVRIRIKGDEGFITIKGKPNRSGTTRFEWEKKISLGEAESLMKLCEGAIIKKTRYLVKKGDHIFEVDEFSGQNKGLILAEVELDSENEVFSKPDWLGEEVTGKKQYYNLYLSKKPFKNW